MSNDIKGESARYHLCSCQQLHQNAYCIAASCPISGTNRKNFCPHPKYDKLSGFFCVHINKYHHLTGATNVRESYLLHTAWQTPLSHINRVSSLLTALCAYSSFQLFLYNCTMWYILLFSKSFVNPIILSAWIAQGRKDNKIHDYYQSPVTKIKNCRTVNVSIHECGNSLLIICLFFLAV